LFLAAPQVDLSSNCIKEFPTELAFFPELRVLLLTWNAIPTIPEGVERCAGFAARVCASALNARSD
jgi:hypothetical protein